MSFIYKQNEDIKVANIAVLGVIAFVLLIGFFMWVMPVYTVWSSTKAGEAELAQAQQNRQIKVSEAQAENEAAISQAEAHIKIAQGEATAEVERAKGVAQANAIIGDSLKGNEDYLRYLYITGLTGKANQIIYVPTEAGLPILEATRAITK